MSHEVKVRDLRCSHRRSKKQDLLQVYYPGDVEHGDPGRYVHSVRCCPSCAAIFGPIYRDDGFIAHYPHPVTNQSREDQRREAYLKHGIRADLSE